MRAFVLKGNIIYSENKEHLKLIEQGYLVCENGLSQGVYENLPEEYKGLPLVDYGNKIIVPGLSDIHAHAPQYVMCANGMDLELLDWLETYTFPVERRYKDMEYAKVAYEKLVRDLIQGATTRICLFGTVHEEATLYLMELLEKAGIHGYVGKVNMDRNSPDYLREEDAKQSLESTKRWIDVCRKFENIKPILTPRFIPSCTDELMKGLGELQRETGLPAQSHLSENMNEISWVKELCPESEFYGDAYDKIGLFGTNGKVIMAHCVHSTDAEIERMKERGVFVAHCALSNTCLASGIAPVKTYLEKGLNVGLGSDIAAGYSLSIFRAMADSIQASKLRWRLLDQNVKPLSVEEAFYLGTVGGGSFFGKVGSFETGYELDAVIIDDSRLLPPHNLSLRERLERIIYLSDERDIIGKYVAGQRIL